MPKDGQINYVELPGRDLAETKTFYAEAFGWTFTDYGAEYTSFAAGLDGGFYADADNSSLPGEALVVLYAEDLEAMLAKVVEAGGTICRPIFEFPGGRRFHFLDPADNEMAVWSDE